MGHEKQEPVTYLNHWRPKAYFNHELVFGHVKTFITTLNIYMEQRENKFWKKKKNLHKKSTVLKENQVNLEIYRTRKTNYFEHWWIVSVTVLGRGLFLKSWGTVVEQYVHWNISI